MEMPEARSGRPDFDLRVKSPKIRGILFFGHPDGVGHQGEASAFAAARGPTHEQCRFHWNDATISIWRGRLHGASLFEAKTGTGAHRLLAARIRGRAACPNLGHGFKRSQNREPCICRTLSVLDGRSIYPIRENILAYSRHHLMALPMGLATRNGKSVPTWTPPGDKSRTTKKVPRGHLYRSPQSALPPLAEKSSDMSLRICFSFSDVSMPALIFTVRPTASFVIDPA
ncbi:hypothetical protein OKW37_000457 [Paraburkholderia sp. MM5482-R2]